MSVGIESAVVDASLETEFDESGRGGPITMTIGNVVFHTSLVVDLEFDITDRTAETGVIFSRIFVVVVVLGIAKARSEGPLVIGQV